MNRTKFHSRMNLKTNFQRKLRELPLPGKGYGFHVGLLAVCNSAYHAGISAKELFLLLKEKATLGTRFVPDSEIEAAIVKAYREKGIVPPVSISRTKPVRPENVFLDLLPTSGITEADVRALSPVPLGSADGQTELPPTCQTELILKHLYEPHELLFIGKRNEVGKPGENICPASDWIDRLQTQGRLDELIIPNPLSGRPATSKSGKVSFRSDCNVLNSRFCIAEFDLTTPDQQLTFLTRIGWPIALITFSGNKSYHAWIDVASRYKSPNGLNSAQWNENVKGFMGVILGLNGADTHCLNPSRLSRLGGQIREGKSGTVQRLVYLNPKPGESRIVNTEVRALVQNSCIHNLK